MHDPRRHIAIAARVITGATGTSRTILDHSRYLTGAGYRVTLMGEKLNRDRIAESGADSCQIVPVKLGSKTKRMAFSLQVSWHAKWRRCDLVWGHGDNLDQNFLSLHNCVHLAHELLYDAPLPASSGVGMMHGKILRQAQFQKLIANSKLMAGEVIARFGVPSEKIGIVYPGYNPKQFNRHHRCSHAHEVRKSLHIPDGHKVIGLVTSGDFLKRGVSAFIGAIAKLEASLREKTVALVIGKTDQKKQLMDLAESLGVKSRIRILPPTPQVEKFYHALDLLVHPARIEEFGQVVQEGIMCGTPVLVGSLVGSAELFQGVGRKLVLPDIEPEAIAKSISRAIADPDQTSKAHQAVYDLMRFNTDLANFEKTQAFLGLGR